MRRFVQAFAGLLVLFVIETEAQYAIPPQMRSQIAMEQLNRGATNQVGNVVYGLAAPPGRVVGDEYVDSNWNIGNVLMQSGDMLERYKVRFDLKSQMLEIEAMQGVKLLDYRMIKSVVWRETESQATRFFVNASAYKDEGTPLVGVLEVVVDGQVPLLRRHFLFVKQPDYVPALDVGSRDTKIYKKSTLMFATGTDLYEIKGKKSLTTLFGEHASKMEEFMKVNDLGVKRDSDLIHVFEYYNSLLAPVDQP
jgi:hypothetical protein